MLQYQEGSPVPISITSGIVSLRTNGAVYLRYKFLKTGSVLVTLHSETQLVLSIEHPNATTMLWIQPGRKSPLYTFTRA